MRTKRLFPKSTEKAFKEQPYIKKIVNKISFNHHTPDSASYLDWHPFHALE